MGKIKEGHGGDIIPRSIPLAGSNVQSRQTLRLPQTKWERVTDSGNHRHWEGLVHTSFPGLSHIQISWALGKVLIGQAIRMAMDTRSLWMRGVGQHQQREWGLWQGMTAEHIGAKDIGVKTAPESKTWGSFQEWGNLDVGEDKNHREGLPLLSQEVISPWDVIQVFLVLHFNLSGENELRIQPMSESSS